MSAKTTTPQQHQMLHQHWPNDCCLCNKEHEADTLRSRLAIAEAALREIETGGGHGNLSRHIAQQALQDMEK